jgi:hypothetical protein
MYRLLLLLNYSTNPYTDKCKHRLLTKPYACWYRCKDSSPSLSKSMICKMQQQKHTRISVEESFQTGAANRQTQHHKTQCFANVCY